MSSYYVVEHLTGHGIWRECSMGKALTAKQGRASLAAWRKHYPNVFRLVRVEIKRVVIKEKKKRA